MNSGFLPKKKRNIMYRFTIFEVIVWILVTKKDILILKYKIRS